MGGWDEVRELCREPGPGGYICTLDPGHNLNHRSVDPVTGAVYDTWPLRTRP